MLSHNLARNAQKEFGSLDRLLQTTLRRYGIEAAEWNAIRHAVGKAEGGREFIFPHLVDSLPDTAFAHLGGDAAAVRTDLAIRLQTYLTDQVREGMTEPTAGIRAAATLGTRAGTVGGELARIIMQFKTYSLTFLTRSVGRELARYAEFEGGRFGAAPLKNTVRALSADPGGLASLIATTTLLGYASLTLKDLVKGRSPRSPQDAGDYFKLVSAAMIQGGGLGIYGDFLFGEANRMGGGFVGTLAGPTLGELDSLRRVLLTVRDGVAEHGTTEGLHRGMAEGFQFAKNNTPFLNLFYTRAALDYLVLYDWQERMNPGYLRRYEQRIKRENNQTFWLRPSQPALPQLAKITGLD